MDRKKDNNTSPRRFYDPADWSRGLSNTNRNQKTNHVRINDDVKRPIKPRPRKVEDITPVWDQHKKDSRKRELADIEIRLAKQKLKELKKLKEKEKREESFFGEDLKKYDPDYSPADQKQFLDKTLLILKNIHGKITRFSRVLNNKAVYSFLGVLVFILVAWQINGNFTGNPVEENITSTKNAVLGEQAASQQLDLDNLYFPSALPEGYFQDEITVQKAEDAESVTIVSLIHDDPRQSIYISQQPTPEGFDIEGFEDSISEATPFTTGDGRAITGIVTQGNRTSRIVSVVTEDTWILVNADPSVSSDVMRSLALSLLK